LRIFYRLTISFLSLAVITPLSAAADPYEKFRIDPGAKETTQYCSPEAVQRFRTQQMLLGGRGSYYDFISTLIQGVAVNSYAEPLSSEDIRSGVVKAERDKILSESFDAVVRYVRNNCPN